MLLSYANSAMPERVAEEFGACHSPALENARAEQRLAADCLQPTLRSGFRQQLKAGVRRLSPLII